jgi:hypothetical protein
MKRLIIVLAVCLIPTMALAHEEGGKPMVFNKAQFAMKKLQEMKWHLSNCPQASNPHMARALQYLDGAAAELAQVQ